MLRCLILPSALVVCALMSAPPHAAAQSVPTDYHAITNTNIYAEPPPPALGAAGWRFTDPAFGSRLMRVTDPNTRPGWPGSSFAGPSAAHQLSWNATSDRFYIRSLDGWFIPYDFDPETMTASRIQPTATGNGGLLIQSHVEPQFSFVSGDTLYAATRDQSDPNHDYPVIHAFDFAAGDYEILVNLRQHTTLQPDTYVGAISSSAAAPERVAVMFGGTGQDRHFKVAVFQPGAPASTLVILDTQASTVTRNGAASPTGTSIDFLLHHAWIDLSGRYVMLYPVSALPVPFVVWDLLTDAITFVPFQAHTSGHDALGYGWQLNQDCCSNGAPYDGAQWQLRTLAAPQLTTDLVTPLSPREIFISDHTSWNNAQPDRRVPVLSSLFRYYNGTYNTTPWRPWDDEIVTVQTDAAPNSATVWRFAHHRSDTARDDGIDGTYFWYQPRGVISPDGRWALFTSNWEKGLGLMPRPDWGGIYRTDVFIVSLAAGTFTDDPLVAGVTAVRAVHFAELRVRIDLLRAAYGLTPYGWSDPAPAAGALVRAAHLDELRTALQQAYAAAGLGLSFSPDPVVTSGSTPIRAAHIQELRQAIVSLEGS